MRKKLTTLLSITLVLSFIMIITIPAHAATTDNFIILSDTDEYRVVQEVSNNKYIHTFDKTQYLLRTDTYTMEGVKLSSETIDLGALIDNSEYFISEDIIGPASTGYYQHTFSNYEYDQLTTTKYQLRNKNSYAIRYTTNNLTAINNYIEAVDALNSAELAVIAAGSATLLWTVLTYLDGG